MKFVSSLELSLNAKPASEMEPFSILSLFSLLWRSPSTFRHLWCTANCPLPDQGPEMPKGFNCTKCQFGSNVLTKPLLPAEQKARTIADAIGIHWYFLDFPSDFSVSFL